MLDCNRRAPQPEKQLVILALLRGRTGSSEWLWQTSQNCSFFAFPIQFCKQPVLG